MERVDLKSLSKALGLSMTTVSRALNGYSEVSPRTRMRVTEMARELGYTPNAQARRLTSGRTESVGFVLSDFDVYYDDPYFAQLLAGLGRGLTRADYDLAISANPAQKDALFGYRRLVEEHRVDGIVLDRTLCDDPRIDYLLARRMPFVTLGRDLRCAEHAFLDMDAEAASRLAVRRLVELGHRRLALIGPPDRYNFAHLRILGFRRALVEAGIPAGSCHIRDTGVAEAGGYLSTVELLRSESAPTAIVCMDDLTAMGAMRAAREHDLEIGTDLSIIGYNDISVATVIDPPLTTLHVPIRKVGERLAEMLLGQIAGRPARDFQEVWEPQLVLRASDGPAPASERPPGRTFNGPTSHRPGAHSERE